MSVAVVISIEEVHGTLSVKPAEGEDRGLCELPASNATSTVIRGALRMTGVTAGVAADAFIVTVVPARILSPTRSSPL